MLASVRVCESVSVVSRTFSGEAYSSLFGTIRASVLATAVRVPVERTSLAGVLYLLPEQGTVVMSTLREYYIRAMVQEYTLGTVV